MIKFELYKDNRLIAAVVSMSFLPKLTSDRFSLYLEDESEITNFEKRYLSADWRVLKVGNLILNSYKEFEHLKALFADGSIIKCDLKEDEFVIYEIICTCDTIDLLVERYQYAVNLLKEYKYLKEFVENEDYGNSYEERSEVTREIFKVLAIKK